MDANLSIVSGLVPHLFRIEYTKLTAVLCRHFGFDQIETAEDIASETFARALESWSLHGIPENPTAWLYKVAKNRTIDQIRRHRLHSGAQNELEHFSQTAEIPGLPELSPGNIVDSQLRMIFAVCNPLVSPEAQVALALQLLCGFSVEEIAGVFLTSRETVKKRLYRAREILRASGTDILRVKLTEIPERSERVYLTLYLLFSEGYFSNTPGNVIRENCCAEAMRLAAILTENKETDTPVANALLALMCYQASRIPARGNYCEELILFEDQDRQLWDRNLIDKGNHYLVKACSSPVYSRYHIEASIAFWHTTAGDNRWQHILDLYNRLLLLEYSPVAALNRTFAFARVNGAAAGITEAEKLGLTGNRFYHSLLGHLYAGIDPAVARSHYARAIDLSLTQVEKKTLQKQMDRL